MSGNARVKDVVRVAKELISIPSLSGEEKNIAYTIRDLLNEQGVDRAFIDEYGNVVGVIDGDMVKSIVFEGHMDHVPPGDLSNWITNPYEPVVKDDKLYGRGSVDMKGAVASMIVSAGLVEKKDIPSIYYVFVPYEEIAEGYVFGKCLEKTLSIKPDLVVLGEATNLNIYLGQRGRTVINVLVKGVSAHASMPEEGVNALSAAAYFIDIIEARKDKFPIDERLGKSTISPTIIECSPKSPPMIPDKCVIIFDYRFVLGESKTRILEEFNHIGSHLKKLKILTDLRASIMKEKAIMWTGKEIDIEYWFPAWFNDNELTNKVLDLIKKYVNEKASKGIWRFSTDGIYSAGIMGVTTIGYGPGDERLAHKPNEYVPVDHLMRAVEGYKIIAEKVFT